MKRFFAFLCVSALVFCLATPVMAGGIDNKHNFSAEYIRTLNRNAATDSADGVVYNPAGVVKMEDGLYGSLSGQYAFKKYTNTVNGLELQTDEGDFVPSLFALWSHDRWAAYGAFTIPAGGGSVDYEDGSATTAAIGQGMMDSANLMANALLAANMLVPYSPYDTIRSMSIEGESFYYGVTLGGAFAVNDMFSVSLGARYIDATKIDAKGSVTIGASTGTGPLGSFSDIPAVVEYDQTATGWGGIIGIDISPSEQSNIALRYETRTELDFEYDVKRDTQGILPVLGVVDGAEMRRDLPALLGFGAYYQFTPEFKVDANLTWYFNQGADWEGAEDLVDDGYDLGLSLQYAFLPQLIGSVGYMWTETGIDADYMLPEAPELDAHSIAGGLKWIAAPGLDVNLGVLKTFYQDETTTTGVKYEKDVIIIALGLQYKFW